MMPPTFRRIDALPPYVFAVIRDLTLELRRAGDDVVDLGFGNPDLPSPDVAVAKLAEAAAEAAQPPLLAVEGHPEAARRPAPTSTAAGSASSSTRRRRSSRRWAPRRASSTSCGRSSSRATPRSSLRRATRSTSTPRCSPARSVFQVAMGPDEDLVANLAEAYERAHAAPPGAAALVPAQPDHGDRRARLHGARRRRSPASATCRRPRLRLRRPRLRRTRPAVDPPGAGGRPTSRSSCTR